MPSITELIDRDGFAMLKGIFSPLVAQQLGAELERAILNDAEHQSAISRGETLIAARNVLEVYPAARTLWHRPPLDVILKEVLGENLGLMRGLYFDKPPQKSWSLPWHQDRVIAVKNNKLPSSVFGKPTIKAGVPHVEAPIWLSQQIIFARIHLDPMLDENGPLQVMPGSHRANQVQESRAPVTLYAHPGDVLLMRPLVFHRSSESLPMTNLHRRVLQLEFTGCPVLPDGYQWHTFVS